MTAAPESLSAALAALRLDAAALRPVEGFMETPYWALHVSGAEALSVWQRLRDQAGQTGFWPVIIGQFGGAEFGGSDAAIERLQEDAQGVREMTDEELQHSRLQRSPAELLESARLWPFEQWVERQRDPSFQVSEHLRKAAFFDAVGAASLAELHRESAERWRKERRHPFAPEDYTMPPKQNKSPPQHELHCVTCYDSGQRRTVVQESVAILFVPTPHSWQVPAYLFFATVGDERPPQVHVAALQWLHERFGADLIGVEDRILEVVPGTRPSTTNDALHAADMLKAYSHCSVTSENEMTWTDELAFYLMESEYWTFCWP